MGFPYIDRAGIQRRSIVRPSYFADVEALSPGFTQQSIRSWTSYIEARLRKRCGKSLPFGQGPAPLTPAGIHPPAVQLAGVPVLGSLEVQLVITGAGPLGTAVMKWSSDGGLTFTSGVVTGAAVALGSTGMQAVMAAGAYDTSMSYAAKPAVPDVILKWLTQLVTFDVLERHGADANDPFVQRRQADADAAKADVLEAANSRDGLWDLPVDDDQGSAITTGGPRFYSETSPYVGQDLLEERGRCEDLQGRGTYGGGGVD